MADAKACINCGSTSWHVLTRWERFVAWSGTGTGTRRVRCEGCGGSQGSTGWYRPVPPGSGPMARLRQLQMVRWQLRLARSWQPVPIFYALVVGAAAVPGVVLAVLTRRRWIALAVPLGAFVGTFLLSARTILQPHNREFVREILDPVGTHRRQVAQEIAALRREGHRFPVVVPADWDGHVRLHGIGVHRRAPDVPLRSVGILAGPADDNGHHPRLRIQALTPDDASAEDALAEQVAHTEAPPEDITTRGGQRLRTPVGRGDDDILVFQMPDPSPERVTELQQSWRNATLLVDGEPLTSRLLDGRRLQVATVDLDGHVLEITGHDVDLDGLTLRRVTDLAPLIAEFATAAGMSDLQVM